MCLYVSFFSFSISFSMHLSPSLFLALLSPSFYLSRFPSVAALHGPTPPGPQPYFLNSSVILSPQHQSQSLPLNVLYFSSMCLFFSLTHRVLNSTSLSNGMNINWQKYCVEMLFNVEPFTGEMVESLRCIAVCSYEEDRGNSPEVASHEFSRQN